MKYMRFGVIIIAFICVLQGQNEATKCYENQKWYAKTPAICPQNTESTNCLYLFDKQKGNALYGITQDTTTQNTKEELLHFVDSANALMTYSIALNSNILTQSKKIKNTKKIEEEHYLMEATSCAYIDGTKFNKEWEDVATATTQEKNANFHIETLDSVTLRFVVDVSQNANQKTSSADFILKPLSSTQAHIIYVQNAMCKILITKKEDILLIGEFETKDVCKSLYDSEPSPLATQYQFPNQTQE